MPILVCRGYDAKQLNKFSTITNLGITHLNRSLLHSSLVVLMLCRLKVHFLLCSRGSYIEKKISPKLLLVLWVYSIYRHSTPLFTNVYGLVVERGNSHLLYIQFLQRMIESSLTFVTCARLYLYWSSICKFRSTPEVALPFTKSTETVLRSSHGHKKSREKFKLLVHRRGIVYPSFLVTRHGYLLRKIIDIPLGSSLRNKYFLSY